MLDDEQRLTFNQLTSHITSEADRSEIENYITRFDGLTFDTSADDYILNPNPALNPLPPCDPSDP